MKFLTDFLKGTLIGIGAVAPSVSGGSFAVMLGVYNKLTDAISNIFKNFRRKVLMLLPLGLGICFGVLVFSNIMNYLFAHYNTQVRFLFIGLMVGTLPSVIKEANKKGFRKVYLIPCLITLCITILFMYLENSILDIIPQGEVGIIPLILYGIIIGFGTIVPGISSSLILMYIGVYEMLLEGIVKMDLMIIVPVGIGFALSILLFAHLINYLFRIIYGYTYYSVLGFVIGSIFIIYPVVNLSIEFIFGVIYCILGALLSYNLSRMKASH
jgi:putative membrane protein